MRRKTERRIALLALWLLSAALTAAPFVRSGVNWWIVLLVAISPINLVTMGAITVVYAGLDWIYSKGPFGMKEG